MSVSEPPDEQDASASAADPAPRPVRASPPSRAPSPLASAEGRMILLFDALWLVGAVVVYAPAALAAAAVLHAAHGAAGWALAAAAAPVAYLAFLLALVLVLGLLSAVLPREREGTSKVFADRAFFVFLLRWGLESYLPAPLITHIQLLTVLRVLHYRLQGAQLGWSTHISPGARIWSPGLVRLGHLTYVGEFAHVTGHLSRGDKLLTAPVVLGDRVNVGAHCNLSPGVTVGSDVRIGPLCDLAPACFLEDGAELGPACQLGMGVHIGRGARLEPRSFVDSWGRVPDGEIWGGDPARKLGVVRPARRRRGADSAGSVDGEPAA